MQGEVEIDGICVVAGHKGQPAVVAQRGRFGYRRKLAGGPDRGTLDKNKPPVLGLIQLGGEVVLRMADNVQQATIKPVIEATVAKGTLVHTDEYGI